MNHDRDFSPEDFDALERQLRAQRPTPTDGELERAKRRAMTAATADRPRARRTRVLSPARLAMVSLVSGALLVGGSSASLAVSGLSSGGSAGIAQYVQGTTETGAVAPSQDQGGNGCSTTGAQSSQTNCPDTDTSTPSLTPGDTAPAAETGGGADPAQETKQVASGGSDERLPFTGLLALPLLLAGVIMLSGGFLLRMRTSERGAR